MASMIYEGNITGSQQLSTSPECALSRTSGTAASGIINSVVARLRFSTTAYANHYNVTATLYYSGGSKSVTREVKMDDSNYTNGLFDFTFNGLTVEQANSISKLKATCSNKAGNIYLRYGQKVTVDYTVLSATTPPSSVTLSSSMASPGASIKLSWSGATAGTNNPITAYEVYRATSSGGTYTLLTTVSSNTTSGSTTVVAPTTNGAAYYYKVKALGTYSGYHGDQSSAYATLTCEYSVAGAPTSVTLDDTNAAPGANVTLSWTGASAGSGVGNAITAYEVYRATSVDGEYTKLVKVSSTATSGSTTVTAPTENGASYYYRVKTIGTVSGYDSDQSTAYAALTCTYSAPTAPATVTVNGAATAYAYPGDTVLLAWTGAAAGANNAVTGYEIHQDGEVFVSGLGPSVESYSVPAHDTAGRSYTYTVVTKGTYSDSVRSDGCVVYAYTDPVAPTAVTVANDHPVAGSRVVLSWTGAAAGGYNAITGYRIYRSTEVNGDQIQLATIPTTDGAASCPVTAPAAAGGTYYFRVETVGSYSSSGPSDAYATVTTGEAASEDSETTVIIRPVPHKPRGFVFGDYDTAAEGPWTLAEWSFPEPQPVTNYVNVPGRNAGPIDASTALTNGDPRFTSRTLQATFECSEGTRLERKAMIDDMVNRLHGQRLDIILPDDPTRYATGRLTVKTEYNDMAHAAVSVTATCDPWRYNATETVVEVSVLEETSTAVLSNSGRMVVAPEVTVTGYGAEVTLRTDTGTWTLNEGTFHLSGFTLQPGNTTLTCSGIGTVIFAYREASL